MHLPPGRCRRARDQGRAAGGRFRARLRSCRAWRERRISSGSIAARNRSSSISTSEEDKELFAAMIAKADVFVQNLKPGAIGKLGFGIEKLRKQYPRLICCSISGYGESGPYAARKAYDLLVQAKSGLASVTGGAGRAGTRRLFRGRHRRRHECLSGDPGGADRARSKPGRARRFRFRCSTPWRNG